MKSNRKWLLAVACLALAALSCQAVSNLAEGGATATIVPGAQIPQTEVSFYRMTFPPPAGGPVPTQTARWNMTQTMAP